MPNLQPCPRCSKRLPSDARFCRRCGLGLAARTAGPAALRPTPVRGPAAARNRAVASSPRQARPAAQYRRPASRGWVVFLIIFGIWMAHSMTLLRPKPMSPSDSTQVSHDAQHAAEVFNAASARLAWQRPQRTRNDPPIPDRAADVRSAASPHTAGAAGAGGASKRARSVIDEVAHQPKLGPIGAWRAEPSGRHGPRFARPKRALNLREANKQMTSDKGTTSQGKLVRIWYCGR